MRGVGGRAVLSLAQGLVLVGVSLLVAVLLARGRVTRAHGLLLLAVWTGYVAVHLWMG